jgi:hypothetical protein
MPSAFDVLGSNAIAMLSHADDGFLTHTAW